MAAAALAWCALSPLLFPSPALAARSTVEEGGEQRLHAYARARLAEANGALDAAALAYREAVTLDPDSPELARRGYRQAVLAGDRDLALRMARSLDAAGQLSRDGSVLLLIDALDRRQWTEAASRIDRLETEGNLAFLAPFMRSWLSLAMDDYAPPVIPPESSPAYFATHYSKEQSLLLALARGDRDGLAEAYAALGDDAEVLGPEERGIIAVRLAKLGQRDLALDLLDGGTMAGESAKDGAESLRRLTKLYRKHKLTPQYGLAMLMNRLAGDLRGQDESVATLSIARMAGFADPASDDVRVTVARAALAADYPRFAYDEAGKVPSASPAWFDAQAVQVRALIRQDNAAEALGRATALVEQDKGSARGWRMLGDIHMQQNSFAEAAQAYQQARTAMGDREDAALLLQLGGALERAGHWDEARPLLERVVELAPDSAVALNHLGYALADRGEDLPRALALLQKANRIRPREPAYVDSLGWAYFRSGDFAKALPLIQSAVEAEPDNSELNEHLGDVLWGMGRRFEARYAWRAALVGLDEDEAQAAENRQRLNDKLDGKEQNPARP
ncbi:MAG: tetratricopeptide repeat protein [Sphingobium sp.]